MVALVLTLLLCSPPPTAGGAPSDAASRRPADGALEELASRLADDSPRTRRVAVGELARLGGREAWGLVLQALADPEAEVADAAQLAFGELDDPRFARELLGRGGLRSPEPGVPSRAAEALGRVRAEIDAGDLAGRLSGGEVPERRLLLWSVERLARENRLGGERDSLVRALVKAQRSKRDPGLAADALLALAELEAETLPGLAADARLAREPELRAAALLAALAAPLPTREAWARQLASDADPGVRLVAAEVLERIGTRAAATVLVERLEREENERVRRRVVWALQSLTGLKHRDDARPWRHWLEQCPEGWLAGARAPRGPSEGESSARGLATLEVSGERVAFLFDFSGSMWEELPDGRTPKDVVDGELRTALERLPEDTEFNLIPYSHEPGPWKERLVPARKQNVRAALDFFERCDLRGRGNVWSALELALSDPGVDSIVVLTDGYPTGGFHADMDLIAPLFAHANRYRRLTLDAVLVDAHPHGVRRWSELALASGGTCTEVSLRR